jgi:N-methylhydantoinase A
VPGPACYAKGGTEPTVTDADLVLGYINADYYLGGAMTVDAQAARRAIQERVADRLGMGVAEAAHGIYRLVNANMIGATRVVTVQRGHDPRDFTLVVSGGTAPIHAVRMAQELRIPRVVIPLNAGVFSAVGLITADARYDVHRSYVVRLSQADPARLEEIFGEIAGEAGARIEELGFAPEQVVMRYEIDMRYLGQAHEVPVEVPVDLVSAMDQCVLGDLGALFHEKHLHLFGHDSRGSEVEIMTLSASAVGPRDTARMAEIAKGTPYPGAARKGTRQVYFEEAGGYLDCDTYERSRLAAGNVITGPAVIEQMDTTTVLPPGETATVDLYGTLIVELAS